MVKKFFFSLSMALTLIGVSACSSASKRSQDELRSLINLKDYQGAIEYVRSNDFYQRENERLLKHLEVGLIHHAKKDYYQSARVLEVAKVIIEELFTVSLSQRAQIYFLGDQRDIYYGDPYEHSMVYFYKALNHYLIYQRGYYESHQVVDENGETHKVKKRELTESERREELFRARAELVAWDSFMHNLEQERLGKSVFKRDLLANILGGLIHEAINTREDREIALNLYQNANDVLLQNYHSYKVFNKYYEKFIEDYKILPELELAKIKEEYINQTQFSLSLSRFINYRRLLLVARHRGQRAYQNELSKLESKGPLDTELKEWLQRDVELIKQEDFSQVTVVVQNGLIPRKQGREIFIGLARALEDPEIAEEVSVAASVLAVFAADILGLLPPPGSQNIDAAYFGMLTAEVAVREAAISFEVPEIEYREINERFFLRVWEIDQKIQKKKSDSGPDSSPAEEVASETLRLEREIPLVQPLGDIASQAVTEGARARVLRQTPRVIGKHAAAIAASYATYQALRGDGEDNSMARSVAVLQYVAASRAIGASEKADVRYWSSLPQDIRVLGLPLPQGKYRLELVTKVEQIEEKERENNETEEVLKIKSSQTLKTIELSQGKKDKVLNFRL